MRQYDWLLFDADNTLFDFHRCEKEALKGALEDVGIFFKASLHDQYSEINRLCWRQFELKKITKEELRKKRFQLFFDNIGVDTDPIAFGRSYLDHLSEAAFLLDGAIDLLEEVQSDFHLALVTNGLKEVQRPRVEAGHLTNFFETIIVSDEIGFSKPHTPFFDYTFSVIDRPEKERVLIIGDNIHADIKGGLDYGIHACWYNPHNKDKPADISPTYEIKHLSELPALFQKKFI